MRDVVTRPALVVTLATGLAGSAACGGSVVHDESDGPGGGGQGAGAGGSGGTAPAPGVCGCVVAFGTGAPGCAICGQTANCGLCTTEPCSDVLLCLSGGGYTEEALAECFTSFPPTEAQEGEFMAWKALTCICNACADKCVAPPPPLCGGN